MKRTALAAAIFALALLPSAAFADGTHSQCDNLDAANTHGNVSSAYLCNAATLGENLTAYAITIYPSTSPGSDFYIGDNGTDSLGHFCELIPASEVVAGTFSTITLPTPQPFASTDRPQLVVYTNSGCTTGSPFLTYYTAAFPYVYEEWYWSPLVPPDTSTHISPVNPMGPRVGDSTNVSTTTAGTSVDFTADWYYASTTPASTGFYYDQVSLELSRVDAASSTERNFAIATDTQSTSDVTVSLPANSAWTYFWKFSGLAPWGRIDGTYTSTQYLYVESNPLPTYFGTSTENLTGLATSTCDILNPTGCVQNALVFLFYPQQTTFDQFKALQGNLRSHAPFGYISYILTGIQGVNGTASSSFSINIDSNIETDYFSPLRAGIAAILFALTAFWFFKRVRDLHL